MAFLKETNIFTCIIHSKMFQPESFKYIVYHFSIRLKLKVMVKSCGEYCATPPGFN